MACAFLQLHNVLVPEDIDGHKRSSCCMRGYQLPLGLMMLDNLPTSLLLVCQNFRESYILHQFVQIVVEVADVTGIW